MTARHMRNALVQEGDSTDEALMFFDGYFGWLMTAPVAIGFTEDEVVALAYLLRAYGIDEITEYLADTGRSDDGYRAVSTVLAAADDIESKEKES